jgi:hypothetical protein
MPEGRLRKLGFQPPIRLALVPVGCALIACVTDSSLRVEDAYASDRHARVAIEPCRSRVEHPDSEIEARATEALRSKLAESGAFEVVADGDVVASCDIELFEAGSALGRWLSPGSSPSLAQVAVTLWEQPGDRELVSVRGKAAVREGGLYTIGADRYILSTAMDEVVDQLVEWARGGGGSER